MRGLRAPGWAWSGGVRAQPREEGLGGARYVPVCCVGETRALFPRGPPGARPGRGSRGWAARCRGRAVPSGQSEPLLPLCPSLPSTGAARRKELGNRGGNMRPTWWGGRWGWGPSVLPPGRGGVWGPGSAGDTRSACQSPGVCSWVCRPGPGPTFNGVS